MAFILPPAIRCQHIEFTMASACLTSRSPKRLGLLQEQVQHGVQPELLQLAQIKGVAGFRARQLYDAGLRSVRDVAEADPSSLAAIFARGTISVSNRFDARVFHGVAWNRAALLMHLAKPPRKIHSYPSKEPADRKPDICLCPVIYLRKAEKHPKTGWAWTS